MATHAVLSTPRKKEHLQKKDGVHRTVHLVRVDGIPFLPSLPPPEQRMTDSFQLFDIQGVYIASPISGPA